MNLLIVFGIATAAVLAIIAFDKLVLAAKRAGQVAEKPPAYVTLAYSWAPVVIMVFVVLLSVQYFNFAVILTLATLATFLMVLINRLFVKKRKAAAKIYTESVTTIDEATLKKIEQGPAAIEFIRSLFPVLLVVFILRSFVVEPFQIPSGSMEPTLEVGDFILVNKFAYGIRLPMINKTIIPIAKPQRGDVMVFRYPPNPSVDYIKRVIGVPGDHIQYTEDKQLIINGQNVAKQMIGYEEGSLRKQVLYKERLGEVEHTIRQMVDRYNISPKTEWTVPEGYYFMMGDNRDNSKDSRFWVDDYLKNLSSAEQYKILNDDRMYMVPEENIVGKAFVVWMHWPDPKLKNMPSFAKDRFIK